MYRILLITLLPLLLFQSFECLGQSKKIYLDSAWKISDKTHASYFRIATIQPDGKYKIADHYMTGRLQMTGYGYLITDDSIVEDGYFIYYDSVGHKTSEGNYRNKAYVGIWKDYYANSNTLLNERTFANDSEGYTVFYDLITHEKIREGRFRNGLAQGKWKYYFKNGSRLLVIQEFKDNIPNGHSIFYDTCGQKNAEGDFIKGEKANTWIYYRDINEKCKQMTYGDSENIDYTETYKNDTMKLIDYYPNGRIRRIEMHKESRIDDRIIEGRCFGTNGKDTSFYPFMSDAEPTINIDSYINKSLHYPLSALKKHEQGFIIAAFTINEDGSVGHAIILRGLQKDCNNEAKRVITHMPKWVPAKKDGLPIKSIQQHIVEFEIKHTKSN